MRRQGTGRARSAVSRGWAGLALLALAACGGSDEPPAAPEAGARAVRAAIANPSQGRWSPVLGLSLVPAAAANLPNGKVVLWSAETRFSFSAGGQTYTSPSIRSRQQRPKHWSPTPGTTCSARAPATWPMDACWSTAASTRAQDQHLQPHDQRLDDCGAR